MRCGDGVPRHCPVLVERIHLEESREVESLEYGQFGLFRTFTIVLDETDLPYFASPF